MPGPGTYEPSVALLKERPSSAKYRVKLKDSERLLDRNKCLPMPLDLGNTISEGRPMVLSGALELS